MLLETPEHGPFLHQPPVNVNVTKLYVFDDNYCIYITKIDEVNEVNFGNDGNDYVGSPKLVSFHHTHTFIDVPEVKTLRIR